MDDKLKRDVRKLMQGAEYDLKAGKDLLPLSSPEDTEELLCHINHVLRKCAKVRGLLAMEKVTQPDLFENARPIILDGEEFVQGRVVYTPNGTTPEQEVTEEE